MARFINPFTQYFDDIGQPLSFGKLFYFKTGTNTLLDTFKDNRLSVANTNPIILSASGRFVDPVFLQDASFRVRLADSNNVTQSNGVQDPVGGESAEGNFSLWNSLTIFGVNDIVQASDGNFYISITPDNQGNDPATDIVNWTEIKFNKVWNPNETYDIDDIVQASDGFLYNSLTAINLNNDPIADSTNWVKFGVTSVQNASSLTFAFENF